MNNPTMPKTYEIQVNVPRYPQIAKVEMYMIPDYNLLTVRLINKDGTSRTSNRALFDDAKIKMTWPKSRTLDANYKAVIEFVNANGYQV